MSENTPTEREAIARIIDPGAWRFVTHALAPFIEKRGAQNDEGWIYQYTYGAGFRTVERVRQWLLSDPIENASTTGRDRSNLRLSLAKADAILALRGEGEPASATDESEGVAPCPECEGAGSDDDARTCETCQGNGEVVVDWDRYLRRAPSPVARPSPPTVAPEVVERVRFLEGAYSLRGDKYGDAVASDLRALLQAVEGVEP